MICDGVLTQTVAPATDLFTAADAREWLRVDATDEDTLIQGVIKAATLLLDGPYGHVGKALITQTWTYARAPLTGRQVLKFPLTPFASLTSITYFDDDNASQTLGDILEIFKEEDFAYIRPKIDNEWPSMYQREDAMAVTAVCGFGDASAVPDNLIVAGKMLTAHMFEHRGDEMHEVPPMIAMLVEKDRVGWLAA